MTRIDDLLAVVLAGGKGERLSPLTRDRAKPAVPFGGGYRIIDFTLSNCFNSGVRRILLLTQYKAMSLDRHIARGWSRFFCRDFGEFIDVVPPQQRIGDDWYQGTANAVYQNIYSIEKERPRHLLILAGDHVYRMDYSRMFRFHVANNADLTVAAFALPVEAARNRLGVLEIDRVGRMVGFEEKPSEPKEIPGRPGWTLASMGIYIFKTDFLFEELCRDATLDESRHDFGQNIIPRLIESSRVFAWPFSGGDEESAPYWRDVGTLESYYEANMDLVSIAPLLNLYDDRWPIFTYQPNDPPPKFILNESGRRGEAFDSLVASGAIVSGGSVRHSVLGRRVRVNSCSVVEDSILFSRVSVGRNARIRRAIIDKGVTLADGETVGFDPEKDRKKGWFVSDSGLTVVPKACDFEES